MRSKDYKNQKSKYETGKWLKYYFEKRTCRKRNNKMTDILYRCETNNLTVKFLIKPQKYYIFDGNHQIIINDNYQKGFDSVEDAIETGNVLFQDKLDKRGKYYYSL